MAAARSTLLHQGIVGQSGGPADLFVECFQVQPVRGCPVKGYPVAADAQRIGHLLAQIGQALAWASAGTGLGSLTAERAIPRLTGVAARDSKDGDV